MTLCVAALAQVPKASFAKRNVVVYAADFQSEGETAKAEIGKKVAQVGMEHHIALIAGSWSRAVDLASMISSAMSDNHAKLGQGFQHILEEAVKYQKRHLADEYVSGALGMSYTDFMNSGKDKLPSDVYRDMISAITRQTLDCTLLVIAFGQMNPVLYRIHESGMVENCEHFSAIGSGYYIAESTLFQREQTENDPIGRTIYNVYEAMRLGSYAPGVGRKFEMWIAEWEYDADDLDEGEEITDHGMVLRTAILPEYHDALERLYKKYGPKKVGVVPYRRTLVKKEELAVVVTPLGQKFIGDTEAAETAANVPESKRTVTKNPDFKQSESRNSEGQQ